MRLKLLKLLRKKLPNVFRSNLCVIATPNIASASSEIVHIGTFANWSVGSVYLAAFDSFRGVFRPGFPKTMKTCQF